MKIILAPNPYRDKQFQTALQAKKILEECGCVTRMCLPFDVDRDFELPRTIRFTDIRPGFVATPLLAGDGHYPMLMKTEKVAARIMRVLKRRRRRVVIDRRYAVMVFFWKLIPEWLWERLNIRKNE